ncbi:DUF6493 family protein [Streptomyces sp. NPDC090022]|uniref:DUF7824 domain-containing protein n=1 Tax=Streptomyces sp. NPDC090022 TaxID=3365920 RepID=UPI00382A6EAB
MNAVLDAVRAGRCDLIPGLIEPLDTPARRALLGELTALRREIRGWDWTRWAEADLIRGGLLLAGAGCHTGAAAAAHWMGARDLRAGGRSLYTDALLPLLADRDPVWLGDLAHRLAARAATAEADFALIRELVLLAGCPAPTTDAFVHGWAQSLLPTGRPGAARSLARALREDPHVTELLPRLFETAEPAAALSWYADPQAPGHWPYELTRLAEEGLVERRVLIDGCTSRLLRGGRPTRLRFYLLLLQRLDLTPAEERERTADWIALTADGPSTVAGHAQQILARLAASGDLTVAQLADMSGAALFRPEKKLVRAQLTLLGKVLRREPAARADLLPVVATVFGHEDTALQERALKLAATHLDPADAALREELAGCAELLSPVHRVRAAELFGAQADAAEPGPYEETLPPAPARRRQGPGPDTVAETVELVSALIRTQDPTVTEFERALDALVRHGHRDRAALAAALGPALADRWWHAPVRAGEWPPSPQRLYGLEVVAAAVLGRVRAQDLVPARRRGNPHRPDCVHSALEEVVTARLREAAHRLLTEPLPYLLATPTWETGTLEPDELVARLAGYGRAGAEPAPADFAQALLRVRRDPSAAGAAAALGTHEGERLAAWLTTTAGEPASAHRRVREPAPRRAPTHWWNLTGADTRHLVVDTGERPTLQREFPAVFRTLGRPHDGDTGCYHWNGHSALSRGVLPEDRETQAAWLLKAVTSCATDDERGAAAPLPQLAELGGAAGPVLHLVVATGLGARHAEDRLAAVDALLHLAARGELDAGRVGRDVAELLSLGTVKPNRLADAARTAAATGAYATTWTVLAQALPALLDAPTGAPRGTGEVLAVAADCAERAAPAGPVPAGLAAAAARAGTSQLTTQSRRLLAALPPQLPPAAAS